jgi:hypothetical protein
METMNVPNPDPLTAASRIVAAKTSMKPAAAPNSAGGALISATAETRSFALRPDQMPAPRPENHTPLFLPVEREMPWS